MLLVMLLLPDCSDDAVVSLRYMRWPCKPHGGMLQKRCNIHSLMQKKDFPIKGYPLSHSYLWTICDNDDNYFLHLSVLRRVCNRAATLESMGDEERSYPTSTAIPHDPRHVPPSTADPTHPMQRFGPCL